MGVSGLQESLQQRSSASVPNPSGQSSDVALRWHSSFWVCMLENRRFLKLWLMVSDQPDLGVLLLKISMLSIISLPNCKVNEHFCSPVYKAFITSIFICKCIYKPNSKKANSSPEATHAYSMPKGQPSRLLGLKSNALTLGQVSWLHSPVESAFAKSKILQRGYVT